MDSLATTISRLHVRQVLRNLPRELNDIYDETTRRVDGQIEGDKKLAEQVFCWMTHAYQQLSLEELQHAIAVSRSGVGVLSAAGLGWLFKEGKDAAGFIYSVYVKE